MRAAILYLNDWSQSGGFNHPVISMEFAAPDVDYPGEDTIVRIGINFQRHSPGEFGARAGVSGLMDTAVSWGDAYGGHLSLDRDNTRLDLGRKIAKPSIDDRLREKVSILIDSAIDDRNLRSVSRCQCEQAYLAIQSLGGRVDQQYAKGNGISGPANYVSRAMAEEDGVKFGANAAIIRSEQTEDGAGRGCTIRTAFQPIAMEAS